MNLSISLLSWTLLQYGCDAFAFHPNHNNYHLHSNLERQNQNQRDLVHRNSKHGVRIMNIRMTSENVENENVNEKLLSDEEVEKVGNLVADDEWMGLTMELAEVVRSAVVEDLKKNTSEFTGKDEYKIGDIFKELDARVKDAVSDMRGKEEYELGDLSVVLDEVAKDAVCELTGKDEYEFGDLSKNIDSRIKTSVAEFCGKDEYGKSLKSLFSFEGL